MIRVLIADEIANVVGHLEKLEPHAAEIDVCGVAHQASAVIEEARLRQPDVLVLNEHLADLPGTDFAAQLESVSPATRVLLMTSRKSSGGSVPWSAGTVQESAAGLEFLEAIRVAAGTIPPTGGDSAAPPAQSETASGDPPAPHRRATVVVAFSGKGGTGTSMVATNLAVTLAGGARGRAALVDIDLQFGDAASMLRVENHQQSMADLAHQGDDIDSDLLERVLATGPAEVRVLRAPATPELAETIAAADLRSIIRATARARQFVVIDTPSAIDERVLEVFELADRVLLVTSYNLSAVRGTKTTLLLLEALGVDPERIDVVLNHTRPRTNYRREDIEVILGRPVIDDLPYDQRVDASLDSGTPIVLAEPDAELARRLVALAQIFPAPATATTGRDPVEVPAPAAPVYRRRFSLGRR